MRRKRLGSDHLVAARLWKNKKVSLLAHDYKGKNKNENFCEISKNETVGKKFFEKIKKFSKKETFC
jgi:hypothetical protein